MADNLKDEGCSPGQNLLETAAEERIVKDMIEGKFEKMSVYSPEDSEALAYRLAEIIVLAKKLYLEILPEFSTTAAGDDPDANWQLITGVRMHLLHTRDCIEDFEQSLLELMDKDRQEELMDI